MLFQRATLEIIWIYTLGIIFKWEKQNPHTDVSAPLCLQSSAFIFLPPPVWLIKHSSVSSTVNLSGSITHMDQFQVLVPTGLLFFCVCVLNLHSSFLPLFIITLWTSLFYQHLRLSLFHHLLPTQASWLEWQRQQTGKITFSFYLGLCLLFSQKQAFPL